MYRNEFLIKETCKGCISEMFFLKKHVRYVYCKSKISQGCQPPRGALTFWRGHKSFSWGHWYSCFGDICPGFQSQGGSLACFLTCVILRFTFGVTPADYRGQHGSRTFSSHVYTCRHVHKHWWRFGAQTHNHPCGEHSTVYHLATLANLLFDQFFPKRARKWRSSGPEGASLGPLRFATA